MRWRNAHLSHAKLEFLPPCIRPLRRDSQSSASKIVRQGPNPTASYAYTTTITGTVTTPAGNLVTEYDSAAGNPSEHYHITFNHPGTFRAAAGFPGLIDDVFGPARLTTEPETNNFTPVSMTV